MTKKASKILLASDILMTKVSEQESNLRWLQDLFIEPLANSAGNMVEIAAEYFNPTWRFDRAAFFKASKIKFDPVGTHFDFNPDALSDSSLDLLRAAIGDNTLLVGYEMSPQTRRVLERIGVCYLDIWLGPVRFLNDLTFAMRSNSEKINTGLDHFELQEDYIRAQARVLKVQSYRGFSRQPFILNENSALFIGQLLTDKALLKDGRMLTVLDFKDEFADICRRYNTLYYARHPFLKKGDEDVLAFARSFRNVKIAEGTGYTILCQKNLSAVYGITSSLVTEAAYFGQKVSYLSRPMFEITTDATERYRIVMQQPLMTDFWRVILSGKKGPFIDPLALGKDKLRDALAFYWSYRQIDKLEYVRAIAADAKKLTS